MVEGEAPITLTVEHIELWFFDDINVAFLKVELSAGDLPFAVVCDLLYRFGRAYPTGWDEGGHGKHNIHRAEWLAADGTVLAASDSDNRGKFLSYTRKHRSPGIAPTGIFCYARWCWTHPRKPACCATARSNTTGCR